MAGNFKKRLHPQSRGIIPSFEHDFEGEENKMLEERERKEHAHLGVEYPNNDFSAEEGRQDLASADISKFNSKSNETPPETDSDERQDFRQTSTAFRTPITKMDRDFDV